MTFRSPFRNLFAREGIFDELGAQPTLTIEMVMRLESAKIYDLEQPRLATMPAPPIPGPTFQFILHRRHADTYHPAQNGPRSGASGTLIAPDHSGTHVDALCHQAEDLKLYGGIALDSTVETPLGFTAHAAETIAPLVTQGFLLDVAHFKGLSALPENYVITAEDLEGTMKAQGQMLMPGGVILIRTGYGQFWNDPAKYAKAAGVAPDANRWLLSKHPRAVGADNLTWDALGVRDETTGATLFGHLELLARNGIYIFENLNLEGLAADHVDHFLFIAAPLKLKGATGAPVRPLAIEIQIRSGEFLSP